MTDIPKAWFKIGNGPGLRTVKEQARGLEKLQPFIGYSSILDLGAAEGFIGKWMIDDHGADHVDCVDSVPERVDAGRRVCAGYDNMRFFVGDLNEPEKIDGLLQIYDIVLCLGILHKLANPAGALKWAATKAYKYVAVRMPTEVVTFELMCDMEWEWVVISYDLNARGEETLIFKRNGL